MLKSLLSYYTLIFALYHGKLGQFWGEYQTVLWRALDARFAAHTH